MSDLNRMELPSELGYRMPGEWEPHSGTLISWPSNRDTWPGERLERVEKVYLHIVKALASCETVHIITSDDETHKRAVRLVQKHLPESIPVVWHRKPGNDVWARDFGPIFIRRFKDDKPEYALTDWGYNAWGEKYPPFEDDNAVPRWFAKQYGIRRFVPDMILEGGSIETNGSGTMLTTESVLLNTNRNPALVKNEIEQRLKGYLGQDNIIWLRKGLAGDDTDGHIDDLSRFLNENTILTMVSDDPDDINYPILRENLEILQKATDKDGRPFNIVTLPMPETRIQGTTVDGSEYVPASYANFYFANGAVLLPVYDPKHDDKAIRLFKTFCPDRKVIPIPCADLVWGQGSIHCITQQLYGLLRG